MTCCWSAKAFIFYWPFLLLPATLIWEPKSSLFLELCDSFRCVRTMLQLNYCLTNWVCPPMPFKAGKWLAIRTPQPEKRLMNRGSIHQKSWKSSLTHGNLFARLDCHWKIFNSFSMKIERQPAAHLWGTSPTSDNTGVIQIVPKGPDLRNARKPWQSRSQNPLESPRFSQQNSWNSW